MADSKHLKSGADYLDAYNWEPGMNDDLAYADRAGYQTSVEMLTTGRPEDWSMFGGPEVGNQYDLDPMGEERSMTTFSHGDPSAHGHIGVAGAEGAVSPQSTETTTGGKRVASAPQNYSRGNKLKG